MKDVEYVYAVSFIKTLENKMLTNSDLLSLINTDGIESAKRFLREHNWSGESTEELLKTELKNAWTAAYEVCPKEAPIDILLYENEFHNLKTVLKAYVTNEKWSNMVLLPSVTPPEEIEAAIKSKDIARLPAHIRDVADEAYNILTSTMDGQLLEVFIDKAEHMKVLEGARASKNEFLIGWAKLSAELTDLKTAWRCALGSKSRDFVNDALIEPKEALFGNVNAVKEEIKRLYPDADTSSIGGFEKWCDNKKLAYAKRTRGESFGFEPILSFLIGKMYEVKAVRIILTCKENGWNEDIIKERLRDAYV